MNNKRWSSVSYLDAIRPDPGWRTDFALLASYSADLIALAAGLLALAGVDDDRGSGSKVDFANAVDQLENRVRLVVQGGRLVAPVKTPRILTILDRYVREVNSDESVASWHPKVALAKQTADDGSNAQWRLWIGSRNLTRDLSWDVGLALTGRSGGAGSEIDGVAELGERLATHADLPGVTPGRVRSELRKVRWEAPPSCGLRSIRLLPDGTERGLPSAPADLLRLVVISPFLDGTTVSELGRWGDAQTNRILISSLPELERLASQAGKPLKGFRDLLYLDAPMPAGPDGEEVAERAETPSQDEEPEPRGLHAKIIFAEHAGRRTIWTGSANATMRGWRGPNVEVVAELEIGEEIAAGLETFVQELAKTVQFEDLRPPAKADAIADRLEDARKHVAKSWDVVQRMDAGTPVITNAIDPNPPDAEVSLRVGLLAGAQVPWPRGAMIVRLAQVRASEITEFVSCSLRLGNSEVSWLQRAPLDPPPDEERDRQALARYLDPRTFLSWIRSLLTGETIDDGGCDWDQDAATSSRPVSRHAGPSWWAPTIEEVLKAWSRDRTSLILIDKKIRHYLKLYQEQPDPDQPVLERQVVDDFHNTWQILRRELIGGNS